MLEVNLGVSFVGINRMENEISAAAASASLQSAGSVLALFYACTSQIGGDTVISMARISRQCFCAVLRMHIADRWRHCHLNDQNQPGGHLSQVMV